MNEQLGKYQTAKSQERLDISNFADSKYIVRTWKISVTLGEMNHCKSEFMKHH